MALDPDIHFLTLNSGSSSIKFSIWRMGGVETLVLSGQLGRIGLADGVFQVKDAAGRVLAERSLCLASHEIALQVLFEWLHAQIDVGQLKGVGHRIVHGGRDYFRPQLITPKLVELLHSLAPLAPHHLPHESRAIEFIRVTFPAVAQVACFDTAFHRQMPQVAQTYALPKHLRDEGLIRYGFHGLSYEYIIEELRRMEPASAEGRVIVAHLGNGASMAAVRGGVSVDTTMGFTPVGGLVMGTRSGDLDPGLVIYLLNQKGLTAASANDLVNHQSGLLGVSEISSDMRELLRREDDPRAMEAIDLFCYQAKKFLAALAAVLGGLDVLIFTAGIGENAPVIRSRICKDLSFLGISIDRTLNDANGAVISPRGAPVTVRVMKTNEELMIARHTAALLR